MKLIFSNNLIEIKILVKKQTKLNGEISLICLILSEMTRELDFKNGNSEFAEEVRPKCNV